MSDDRDSTDTRTPWLKAADGAYLNAVTGAASAADPRRALQLASDTTKEMSEATADRLVLLEWGCEKHVTRLPKEATRRGFELKLNGEDLPDTATRDVLGILESVLLTGADDVAGYLAALYKAKVLERQYGGALVIAWTSDSADPAQPLSFDRPWELQRLEIRSRWEVNDPSPADEIDLDPASPTYGLPTVWRLAGTPERPSGIEVHASRCYRFPGWSPERRERLWDWGRSVLENFAPAWESYVHAYNEALAVVPRLSETRLAIKGLRAVMASTSAAERARFNEMLGEVAVARSALKIFAHDSDETITDASIPLDGADLMIQRSREHVAAAADVSIQKFFSLQQQGMSNNDASGERRDDAVTEDFQSSLRGPLDWLCTLALHQLGLSEAVTDWEWAPRPLSPESATQRAERHGKVATALQTLDTLGAAHPIEIRNGLRAMGDWPVVWDEAYDAILEDEAAAPQPEDLPPPGGGGRPPEAPAAGEDPEDPEDGDEVEDEAA